MASTPLLSIQDLGVAFRQGEVLNPVVNGLSLQIEKAETLALVGESGSGKSVTALSVLRLLPSPPVVYTAGDIQFNGNSLLHAPEAELRKVRGNQISMIFQEPMVSLNPLHTIENSWPKYWRCIAACGATSHAARSSNAWIASVSAMPKDG